MVLASLGCSASANTTSANVNPTKSASPWKQVWADNFNGPADSSVNTSYWEFNTGQGIFGTGEVETIPRPCTTFTWMVTAISISSFLGHGAAGSPGSAWTSARIRTKSQFEAPAGGEMMVTASIEQPGPVNPLGLLARILDAGAREWPKDGEIDIMEDVNGLSQEAGTLHCGNLTQRNPDGTFGPCHEGTGLGSGLQPCTGCQQGFHTYTVIVDRRDASNQQIRWYLDGHEFFSLSESRVGQAAWTAAVDHGFSILLDVAVGGSYPNIQCGCTAPDSQTSSQGTMVVSTWSVYTN